MSKVASTVKKLRAGEHYGAVFHKRRTEAAVYSESVYNRSMCLPEHAHELGFFTLILEGYYSEILARKTVVYSPMTVLWRQAELSHRDRIEAASSRFFFVEVQRGFADRVRECGPVPDHYAEQNGAKTWLSSRLRNEVTAGDASSPLIIDGITLEMLGMLVRERSRSDQTPPKWLARVVERLDAEYAGNLTSEMLADEAGVHPVHLSAVFRRFRHETVGDYVQKRRVGHAARLLADRDMPLSEIAYECGFADQSHFTRVFKRRMGATPGAYRDSLRNA